MCRKITILRGVVLLILVIQWIILPVSGRNAVFAELPAEEKLFMEPAAAEIVSKLRTLNPNQQHPRLLVKSSDFNRIKSQISKDKYLSAWFKNAVKNADKILKEAPVKYELPDGVRLLSVSRKALDRIQTLSAVYRLTGEVKYADRAWLELMTISGHHPDQQNFAFADWHPVHFLDTAEMTNAAAIGFDWLYDYLTREQREIIKNAIVEKGLKPAMELYVKKKSWTQGTNNWNSVCNGGMVMGALAIADEDPDTEALCGETVSQALKSLPKMLAEYAPDGAWYEGPGYWDYGTTYLAYLVSALDSALGTDYGLSKQPGLSSTADFPIFMSGPLGTFNFADANASFVKAPVLLWLAAKFDKPEYARFHNDMTETKGGGGVMDMIWYRPASSSKEVEKQDRYFRGVETVGGHSSLLSPDESFLGFKAGTNGLNHGDLDIGSFVFDALGVRWAVDLGPDDYNLPGYFDSKSEKRWQYYRKNAQGHNTLLINPGPKPGQNPSAKTVLGTFMSGQGGMMAITDMTPAYKEDALSVKRGVAMVDGKKNLLIQDEIHLKSPSEVWWLMHTKAEVNLTEDRKSALLQQNGKRLWAKIITPEEAGFEVMEAAPLPGTANPSGQAVNTGVKRLSIHRSEMKSTCIRVLLVPLVSGENPPVGVPREIPLTQWSSPAFLGLAPVVLLKGSPVEFDTPPVIEDNTTLIPFRKLIEMLGGEVQWEPATQTITAKTGMRVLKLQVGSTTAEINGVKTLLAVPPKVSGERTLVPLRFICEALGRSVDWDEKTATITISDGR